MCGRREDRLRDESPTCELPLARSWKIHSISPLQRDYLDHAYIVSLGEKPVLFFKVFQLIITRTALKSAHRDLRQ